MHKSKLEKNFFLPESKPLSFFIESRSKEDERLTMHTKRTTGGKRARQFSRRWSFWAKRKDEIQSRWQQTVFFSHVNRMGDKLANQWTSVDQYSLKNSRRMHNKSVFNYMQQLASKRSNATKKTFFFSSPFFWHLHAFKQHSIRT